MRPSAARLAETRLGTANQQKRDYRKTIMERHGLDPFIRNSLLSLPAVLLRAYRKNASIRPESTAIVCPVVAASLSEASRKTASATSPGETFRFSSERWA